MIGVNNAPLTSINGVLQPANGTILYTPALLGSITAGKNTANVNQLTDKIASDLACTTGIAAKATTAAILAKADELRSLIIDVLTAKNVSNPGSFDPVTAAMKADHASVDAVLDTIRHHRDGWGSGTDDQLRGTKLDDENMQEISTTTGKLSAGVTAYGHSFQKIVEGI